MTLIKLIGSQFPNYHLQQELKTLFSPGTAYLYEFPKMPDGKPFISMKINSSLTINVFYQYKVVVPNTNLRYTPDIYIEIMNQQTQHIHKKLIFDAKFSFSNPIYVNEGLAKYVGMLQLVIADLDYVGVLVPTWNSSNTPDWSVKKDKLEYGVIRFHPETLTECQELLIKYLEI